MYDDDRPRHHYRARSRDRDYDRDYDRGRSSYRRSSRSPRRERDEGDYEYYRPRNDDHSSLPYDDDQPDYRSRDRDRDRDRRPASRSPHSRRYAPPPAQPSPTIIVQGLPGDATEDDIIDGFASVSPDLKVFNADNIKAVRLRSSGRGRTNGFVEFADANAAAHFLEFHYPSLEFQLAHSRGVNSEPVSVRINYSWSRDDEGSERARDDRARDTEDWKCAECAYMNYGSRGRCHRCRADKPEGHHRRRDGSASYGPKLTGETDECPQQFASQYLVIRGLEPSVTEEIFAEGVKKLYIESKSEPKKDTHNKLKSTAPTARTASLGAKPDSLRRVFLVRDKKTNDAMRYGFAEFATLEDAQGAMEKFKASPKFAISTKPVTVAFIHTGVFIPHTGRVTHENRSFVFHPLYNKDILLKYWDNRVYPSILRVSDDSDAPTQHSTDNVGSSEKPSDEATAAGQDASAKKLKKFKINQSAAKPAIVMGPQMQMWAKKRAELVGQAQAQAELDARSTASSPAPSERGRGSTRTQAKDSYISYGDTDNLSCLLCLRKFDSLLALRDHEALNKDHIANLTDEGKRDAAAERLRSQAKRPQVVTLRVSNVSRQPSDMIYTSYADRDDLHCLICQRKFTKAGMLSLHERESEMHRLNMADQSNIDRAISQLARVGKTPRKMVPAKTKGTQYRDRAKERRQAFKQPNAPRRKAPKEDAAAAPAKEAEKPAAPSKGAALLGKMGWSAGEGLGAEGSGRTDVIATDVYASGVGLGAEGGRLGDAAEEAARKTKDNYTDFVEVTRNKARERYERLG